MVTVTKGYSFSHAASARSNHGCHRLSNEIKAFETYMRLLPEEKSACEAVIVELKSILEIPSLSPRSLSLVGSHSTDLATPTSDIDFALSHPSVDKSTSNHKSRSKMMKATNALLLTIQRRLHKSKTFSSVEIVFGRIPLVRAVHWRTGLQVQISTQSPDRYDKDFTAAYLAEFPTLRAIFIVLRCALEMRNLNTPFEGGLGSYSILMMIVAALKQNSGQFARNDLAKHLLHVLDFYANADLYDVGYCINPPQIFSKASSLSFPLNPLKPYLLCLQDPADPTNDLGRKAYAIKHVQKLFEQASKGIKLGMAAWEQKTVEERKLIDGGLLNRLVRANYSTFEKERNRVKDSFTKVTKEPNTKRNASTEPKPPDLSRLASLRGLRKLGWGGEVNKERARRGRDKRQKSKERRAELAMKKKARANVPKGAKGKHEPIASVPDSEAT